MVGGIIRNVSFFPAAVLCGLALFPAAAASPAPKPNIIVVLFDDLGGRELGCYGNAFNETPRIDRLATEGIQFNRAYAPTPICSPSRASLLTGEAPARHGITDYLEDKDDNFLDPARHATIAKTLKAAGYHTGMIGKWHLTGDYRENRATPAMHGFDEAILTETSYIGGGDYRFPYAHIAGATQKIFPEEDLTERLNLEAVEYIERNRAAPFFLYLAHYAVHTTLDAPDSVVARFDKKRADGGANAPGTRNAKLAAMAKGVDAGVGQILAKLKQLGLDSNTLVIVTSDNGGEPTVTDNGELRLGKGNLYEGGIRIPCVARWPGAIPPGRISDRPISHTDLFPTFAALGGAALPAGQAMDGASIEGLLRGTGEPAPRSLTWHFPQAHLGVVGKMSSSAMLDAQGKKLIRFYDTDKLEVYLPATDVSEAADLAPGNPNVARAMATELFATIARQQQGYVFRDDFADKDMSGWAAFGGAWSPAAGAFSVGSGEGFRAITEDRYFGNLIYQAEVVPDAAGNAGLVFRAGNDSVGRFAYRGYLASLDAAAGEVFLGKTDDGASTTLARKAIAIKAGAPCLLRVVARGAEIKVFVKDTVNAAITVEDRSFDGGLIGLRAHHAAAAFDAVYARALGLDSVPVAAFSPAARATGHAIRARRFEGTWLFQPTRGGTVLYDSRGRPGPSHGKNP